MYRASVIDDTVTVTDTLHLTGDITEPTDLQSKIIIDGSAAVINTNSLIHTVETLEFASSVKFSGSSDTLAVADSLYMLGASDVVTLGTNFIKPLKSFTHNGGTINATTGGLFLTASDPSLDTESYVKLQQTSTNTLTISDLPFHRHLISLVVNKHYSLEPDQ
jgi:hypothetical protein